MDSEKRELNEEVRIALADFIIRASSKKATSEEISVLADVAIAYSEIPVSSFL